MNSILRVNYFSVIFLIVVLLIFPLLSLSAPVFSQDDLSRTLEKFVKHGDKQLYKGTFVYLSDDGIKTIRVLREEDNQGIVRESFIPQDNHSPASNRLLKNHFCLLDNGWKYQFQAFSSSFPFRINNTINYLRQNYQINPVKLERVAGLNAQHISFLPRDQFRYGYELWLEPETGLLLRYQLKNDRNETIEQYLYSNISIKQSQEPFSQLIDTQAVAEQIPLCSAFRADNVKRIDLFLNRTRLPDGFQIISYRQNQPENSSKLTEQLHLSDGLAAVSVFIEPLDDASNAMEGIAKIGPLTVVGKTNISKDKSNTTHHQITVVGAIPVDTAIGILDSIEK